MSSLKLDVYQFAYKQECSTDDAILCTLHCISKHLENTKAYARIVFVDFSSAFNTVQIDILLEKLKDMSVNTTLIKWFYSFFNEQNTASEGQQNTVRHQTL